MTTKSPIRNIKSRLPISNSVNNMSTNINDIKSSRICIKRPLSTANFLSNNSTKNSISTQFKKRTLQINNFFNSKIKLNHSNEQTNGYQSNESTNISSTQPFFFHAIAPASPEDVNNLSKQTNGEQKTKELSKFFKKQSNNSSNSPTSRRIAHVLAHTKIKTMSTDQLSSCSENDDDIQSKFHSIPSSIDGDADESDNDSNNNLKKSLKFRRFQKTRKSSNSSLIQKFENTNEQRNSSSNDDENKELNGNIERRTKPISNKKFDRSIKTSITITDNGTINKQIHVYHPLDNLESKILPITNESSPVQTVITTNNQTSMKKINRFQVKSIRKSQQQILLANALAAKSSNDDDCSVPNEKSNLQLKPSIINRKYTNTPTTDGENSTINTDNLVNNTIENEGHHVRFHVTTQEKKQSNIEEEKPSNPATVALQTPTPSYSTNSAQGEDDEEEAIAKSPDNRFIKYAKEIGRGAFKTVYRGLDTETSVAVAWCELQDFAQFDRHERARFKEEAEMLKKLQHPNIVRFYDFWEETNPRTNKKVIILVTELMTSGSLKGYIRKFKGQKEEKRINVMKKWCRQILKGLAYLHSRNPPVIHRDLKCDNVFISSTTGCVKIGDLGLATFKTQTFAKSMRGTMEFMAPEMFDEQYDELVDIYSFGLCMLEMITGEYPYIECKGPTAVIKRVTAGLKPDCYYKVENEDVREVVDCCIRTNKEERLPVNELLQHSFFLDDNGLRIDFVRDPSNDLQVLVANNSIDLKLKIVDKAKRKDLWTEHEAIRFRYNFEKDTPEQIVDELIQKKYIFDEDKKFIIQSIKDRLRAYQYEQIDRKAGVFCRDGKPIHSQSSIIVQQQQQQQQQVTPPLQQPIPIITQPQVTSVPTPIIIQQPPVEIQQIVKPSTESLPAKPTIQTEPIPITQLSDLSSSVSGSAGSLEVLDAALKKTFNKNNLPQSTSTITNENIDTSTSLVNQDESSNSKLGNDQAVIIDQQQKEEITNEELTTNLLLPSTTTTTTTTLQTQSQPTTMLTNHQQQLLQNSLLLNPTPSSFSFTTVTSSPHIINTTISTDSSIKQQVIPPGSSSSINSTTIENSHLTISPSVTNEINQSTISSDTTTQQPILGSLKQLDALLKNTFKHSSKSTGTAHNSDTETANPNISLTINDENSIKTIDFDSEETKRKLIDLFNTANPTNVQSQPNISSLVLPKPIQQIKSQPTSQISTHFDPLISPERISHELDQTIKTPNEKSFSNDDTITASSSSNDLTEIKMLIMDLNKTLINRMNTIENKIDEHRNQTIKINNLLTNTVLPSLIDLADIIYRTPNIDSCVRTKLEYIQTNIRTSQQETEMKDLMEI